jgi:hypothetical protein
VFDTNLRHTPLIWAIEIDTLSVLFTSSALTYPDRYMDVLPSQRTSLETFLTPDQNRRDSRRRLQAADQIC